MNVTKTVTAPLNAVFAIVKFTAANPAGPATAWTDNVVFEETNLAFTYDGNGNTTQDKVRGISYIVYNSLNLPTQLTNGSGTVSYGYLWSGARWFKKIPGSANVSYYIRGTGGELLGEYTNTPSTVNYLNRYGMDLEGKWQKDTGTDYYYLKDHLGNIRQILRNSSGTPVITFKTDYYPFGAVLRETSANTAGEAKFKYQAKERDLETGYDYFEARLFDSQTIRFLQVDKYAQKYVGMNPFSAMGNNPIILTDFTGDTLDVGGNQQQAFEYLQSILPEVHRSRLTMESNGRISFNTDGLELSSDSAIELINNIVNGEKIFLFEVADASEGVRRDDGSTKSFKLNETHGILNHSETFRNANGGAGTSGIAHKAGYNGQVTIGTGTWNYLTNDKKDSGIQQPTSSVVFHELAENYSCTAHSEPYMRNDRSGAHQNAVNSTTNYKGQANYAGMVVGGGVYHPQKNKMMNFIFAYLIIFLVSGFVGCSNSLVTNSDGQQYLFSNPTFSLSIQTSEYILSEEDSVEFVVILFNKTRDTMFVYPKLNFENIGHNILNIEWGLEPTSGLEFPIDLLSIKPKTKVVLRKKICTNEIRNFFRYNKCFVEMSLFYIRSYRELKKYDHLGGGHPMRYTDPMITVSSLVVDASLSHMEFSGLYFFWN